MALGNMLILLIQMLLLCSGAESMCKDLCIYTPSPMEALSGSCLYIPCRFELVEFSSGRSVISIWFKNEFGYDANSEHVISVSGDNSKSYPMNITGNLKNKDCTTLFYNLSQFYADNYYMRIDNNPIMATSKNVALRIIVKDSPWSPSVQISGELTETKLLTITCSAVTPCPLSPPQLTWDLQQGTPNIIETNSDGTFVTKITQNITLTHSHDGLQIRCSAAYPATGGVKTTTDKITLNVTYAPKNTSVRVSPSGPLSAGQLVNLSCSSQAKPPVDRFTWFRVRSQGADLVHEGDTYSFNLTEEGDYYCVASNSLGNSSSPGVSLGTKEPNPVSGLPREALVGAGIGLLIVICLAVFVWYFKLKHRDTSEQRKLTKETDAEQEDTVQYGEIDFTKLRPKMFPDREQEESVYAQVRISKAENPTTQASEDTNEVYAVVKKN